MRLRNGEPRVSLADGDGDAAASAPRSTVSITCAVDACTHEVREADLAPGAGRGRFPALCGQTVVAASMTEPDARRCPRCSVLRADEPDRRRVGLLRRITGR